MDKDKRIAIGDLISSALTSTHRGFACLADAVPTIMQRQCAADAFEEARSALAKAATLARS